MQLQTLYLVAPYKLKNKIQIRRLPYQYFVYVIYKIQLIFTQGLPYQYMPYTNPIDFSLRIFPHEDAEGGGGCLSWEYVLCIPRVL